MPLTTDELTEVMPLAFPLPPERRAAFIDAGCGRRSGRDRSGLVVSHFFYQVRSHAPMHLQIVEIDVRLTRRYVANAPHSWTMRIGPTETRGVGWN